MDFWPWDAGDAEGALTVWTEALALLPEPRRRWEALLWLNASIGDAERERGNIEAALAAFEEAAASAGMEGVTNPFVLWGIGACLYDLGRVEEATDPLPRAYMLEGEEIFEDSDPRYLEHLRQRGLIDR
ncbi:tetratricopeptide repeat protein [Rhizobium halophytocola]|uniref:tetratricopeptide repeat protein n=1 Tax=Rhizobium halophytocola TaxID=735519 RepID=UPI001AE5ABF9|nr:tetratricopeptide repeat protein [Rhizobium halophytocola]